MRVLFLIPVMRGWSLALVCAHNDSGIILIPVMRGTCLAEVGEQ